MRAVYQAEIMTDAAVVRDMLAEAGIRAQLHTSGVLEGWMLVLGATSPTRVWVREADVDRARELIRKLEKSRESAEQTPWTCRGCREDNPGQFDVCWSCGSERTW